jgi:hypothetical protein
LAALGLSTTFRSRRSERPRQMNAAEQLPTHPEKQLASNLQDQPVRLPEFEGTAHEPVIAP